MGEQNKQQGWFLPLRLATYVILLAVVVFWMGFPGYLRLEFILYSLFTLGVAVCYALQNRFKVRTL
ncbi:MAG: hypothetical protein ACOYVF_06555, partial [Candidatus Zixiibacteriota bacterium]